MSLTPSVRYARIQDVSLILRFIQDAADDQAPGTKIAATEDSLAKTLHFGPPSDATTSVTTRFAWVLLIFSPDGKPAGQLIYYYNYSTWMAAPGVCMEELYVVPEYRRHGYAQILLEALASAAESAGCGKMDWLCLSNNEKALRFYDKLGAKRMDNWIVLRVDKPRMETLASPAKRSGVQSGVENPSSTSM